VLQVPNIRNFFLKKVLLAQTVEQAFYALNGLKITSAEAPFMQLANSKEVDVSQIDKANAVYQFYDMIGNPVPYKLNQPTAIRLVASSNKDINTVDRTTKYKFKKDEGSLSVPLNGVPLGNYWLQFEFTVKESIKANTDSS